MSRHPYDPRMSTETSIVAGALHAMCAAGRPPSARARGSAPAACTPGTARTPDRSLRLVLGDVANSEGRLGPLDDRYNMDRKQHQESTRKVVTFQSSAAERRFRRREREVRGTEKCVLAFGRGTGFLFREGSRAECWQADNILLTMPPSTEADFPLRDMRAGASGSCRWRDSIADACGEHRRRGSCCTRVVQRGERSEEHTSELQSQSNLVCRLLLEKKKKKHDKTRGGVSRFLVGGVGVL